MEPNHLHLHVLDLQAACEFYARWFGLREHARHGTIVFLRSAGGFDLALAPDHRLPDMPPWFHFGFRLEDPEQVRSLHERMQAASVPVSKPLLDEDDLVTFTCADLDGYRIEVYCE